MRIDDLAKIDTDVIRKKGNGCLNRQEITTSYKEPNPFDNHLVFPATITHYVNEITKRVFWNDKQRVI